MEQVTDATKENEVFNEDHVIHELQHYLPTQAPLKDFIHHNSLHAFQHLKFFTALHTASKMFGFKTALTIDEYRELYHSKKIDKSVLKKVIAEKKGGEHVDEWLKKLLNEKYDTSNPSRIGHLRSTWKDEYRYDIDLVTHPALFRIICSFLDQGISIWNFPVANKSFLASLKELEKKSSVSIFKTKRVKQMLLNGDYEIKRLLKILVGDESLYRQYLFDQQFAHQGWSGMVATVEAQPESLLDQKKITLRELITLELLLEIDALDDKFGPIWSPLAYRIKHKVTDLFAPIHETALDEALTIWQLAYEHTYYEDVLSGIKTPRQLKPENPKCSFQIMFCIDDREYSLRHYLEKLDPNCSTYGTPGFFNVEFYFKPDHGKFVTKLCPAPVTPKYLIKETGTRVKRKKELSMIKHTHSLFRGWLIAQTLGFWSAFQLFLNVFRPAMSPATASSFKHMDKHARLIIECDDPNHKENHLQVGFTFEEMTARVEGLLRSIGLVKDFAPLVYVVGHGSSSVNNTYYAGYDCGACSGRPGSVNARVICYMANHPKVREALAARGIVIPAETQFVGGLHDTTRDEIAFFDEDKLSSVNKSNHQSNEKTILEALDLNAKERSRRFESINTHQSPKNIHESILRRSVSLFEPRPEYNHATNTLCIVGRRSLTKGLFLDRRAFMNSYDYTIDPDGKLLVGIMKPLGPVCGGINLEYFFSRVDNQRLGAGTKLPHNVMGLFGVANGADGDLRPGLPSQMIEIHDPIRLLIIVEHFPEVVLKTIQAVDAMYEWFINEWVNLVAIHPETGELYFFGDGEFKPYQMIKEKVDHVEDLNKLIEKNSENIPVYVVD